MDSVACWSFCIIITLSLVIPTVTPYANSDGENVTCVYGECLSHCVNVTSTGECLQCLDFRFYGKQCENACPCTCLNCHCQLISGSVVCKEGCEAGKKGDSCGVDCAASCTHCERYGDRCVGPCKSQLYHGDFCNKTCPEECRSRCNKTTGNCNSCKPGHTGSSCAIICSSGCTDKCDVHTDNCDRCVEGYKGKHCNETCSPNCADGCDRDTGKCFKCKSGYTGSFCTIICSSGCTDKCDVHTDKCDRCVEGYKGRYCDETCPPLCTKCERFGCTVCRESRFYGDKCEIPCPSICSSGCDIDTGDCNTYAPSLKPAFGVVSAVALIGLVMVIVLLLRRRSERHTRQQGPDGKQGQQPRDSDHSDMSQYLATKYWEIDDSDLDPDSMSSNGLINPQSRPTSSQRPRHNSLVLRANTPLSRQSVPDVDEHPSTYESIKPACLLSDVDSILENRLYQSAEAGAACAPSVDVMAGESMLTRRSDKRDADKKVCVHADGSECFVTLEDLRLTRKTESQIIWEQNTDFSQVAVKYINPKIPDDGST